MSMLKRGDFRHSRRGSGENRMEVILRTLTILCLALIVYGHVWQRIQVLRVGYKISEAEIRKEELAKEYRALWLQLRRLESIGRIENVSEVEFGEKLKVIELVSSNHGNSDQ